MISWIKSLYNSPKAVVTINGFKSSGCTYGYNTMMPTLSSLFYLHWTTSCITPLKKGVQLATLNQKISIYADDILLYLQSPQAHEWAGGAVWGAYGALPESLVFSFCSVCSGGCPSSLCVVLVWVQGLEDALSSCSCRTPGTTLIALASALPGFWATGSGACWTYRLGFAYGCEGAGMGWMVLVGPGEKPVHR